MNPLLYLPIFLYLVIILTFATSASIMGKSYRQLDSSKSSILYPLLLILVLAVWIGMRPIATEFGDTALYAHQYNLLMDNPPGTPSEQFEWLWLVIMRLCSSFVDVQFFFTIVSLGYFGCTLWACKRLFPNNIWIAIFFNLAAFSFYTYGVNGIRNGLACSIVLVAMTYIAVPGKRNILIAAVLSYLAFSIHRSVILPCAMLFLSAYWIKNFKTVYIFWVLSIVISLVAGSFITSLFVGLSFDDRMARYAVQYEMNRQATIGFRWDFILYSAMPIILGYYVIVKKGIKDTAYMILLNTYTLSNAFWVMVIRANYSNRFAYLSWFMYAIVLAYPCLKLNVWGKRQGQITAYIMLAQVAFRWIMNILNGY